MLDLEQLSKLRFGMSTVPQLGGQPGTYEERWSQWFLERSFFRDFVYRNPRGPKKGQELADAVVLFDDVVLMVQVKAQCGKHDPIRWAEEKLSEAYSQLRNTHEALVGGRIKTLRNDLYGEIEFKPRAYPNRIGMIILAHDANPYIASQLVPEILTAGFPIHVFSLKDFALVASRFDTAADMVTFLEMRCDAGKAEVFHVQDEVGNIGRIIPHVEELLRAHSSPTSPEILKRTVRAFEKAAQGSQIESADWRFGLSIDDMIARVHDADPNLPWNQGRNDRSGLEVARFLGWLSRDRRIRLGKRLISNCEAGRDGKLHYFSHLQRSRGTVGVYLVTSESRSERVKTLQFLCRYAHVRYGVSQCFGVATEPLGEGRSYDFLFRKTPPAPKEIDLLKTFPDPFTDDNLTL